MQEQMYSYLILVPFPGMVEAFLQPADPVIHNIWKAEKTGSLHASLLQGLEKAVQIYVMFTCERSSSHLLQTSACTQLGCIWLCNGRKAPPGNGFLDGEYLLGGVHTGAPYY